MNYSKIWIQLRKSSLPLALHYCDSETGHLSQAEIKWANVTLIILFTVLHKHGIQSINETTIRFYSHVFNVLGIFLDIKIRYCLFSVEIHQNRDILNTHHDTSS